MTSISFKRHRFPPDTIRLAIWLYFRASVGLAGAGRTSVDQQITIDPTRVFAGVITGIGFLGAGALLREEHFVKGVGSAASIWAAGAIE